MANMVTVEIIGLKPIIAGLNDAPKTVEGVSVKRMRGLGPVVRGNVRRHTPKASGALSNAIEDNVSQTQPQTVTLTVEANGSVKPVVVASVAHGTRPHWPPWGPGSALAKWAAQKGIPVFLVARAISRRGTIKRFGGPSQGAEMFANGLDDSKSDIDNMQREMEKDLAKELI